MWTVLVVWIIYNHTDIITGNIPAVVCSSCHSPLTFDTYPMGNTDFLFWDCRIEHFQSRTISCSSEVPWIMQTAGRLREVERKGLSWTFTCSMARHVLKKQQSGRKQVREMQSETWGICYFHPLRQCWCLPDVHVWMSRLASWVNTIGHICSRSKTDRTELSLSSPLRPELEWTQMLLITQLVLLALTCLLSIPYVCLPPSFP